MNYLVPRVLQAAAQIAALSLLTFALSSIVPGDVLSEVAVDPQLRGTGLETLRHRMQLDVPWPQRYLHWMSGALRGDLGVSLSYGLPVTNLIAARLPQTLEVAVPAWILSWVLGVGLAAAGLRFHFAKWLDAGAAIAEIIPEVILATIISWPLLVYLQLEPGNILLPLLPVTLGLAPTVFLHASGSLANAAASRAVQLAGLVNLGPRRLWFQYMLPAAGNPLISLLGPSLVAAFGSTLVVEAVTGWPGTGTLFLDAFRSRDYPVTQAILLMLGSVLAVTNAFADLLLFRFDPRIRYASK
jgi:peptide/nickel transport system permease protein